MLKALVTSSSSGRVVESHILRGKILDLSFGPRLRIVKGGSGHRLHVKSHLLVFLKDSVETVYEIIVILVTFKDIKAGKHKFVFFLNQLIQ